MTAPVVAGRVAGTEPIQRAVPSHRLELWNAAAPSSRSDHAIDTSARDTSTRGSRPGSLDSRRSGGGRELAPPAGPEPRQHVRGDRSALDLERRRRGHEEHPMALRPAGAGVVADRLGRTDLRHRHRKGDDGLVVLAIGRPTPAASVCTPTPRWCPSPPAAGQRSCCWSTVPTTSPPTRSRTVPRPGATARSIRKRATTRCFAWWRRRSPRVAWWWCPRPSAARSSACVPEARRATSRKALRRSPGSSIAAPPTFPRR